MELFLLGAVVALSLALAVAGARALLWSVLSFMEWMQRHTVVPTVIPQPHDAALAETPLGERLAA